MIVASKPEEHRVYTSLYRPLLLAGAEPAAVVVEFSTAFALVFGIGMHVATALLAVFYLTVVHSVMVWVARQDVHLSMLYVRSLSGRDFYPPHGTIDGASVLPKPSIPRSA